MPLTKNDKDWIQARLEHFAGEIESLSNRLFGFRSDMRDLARIVKESNLTKEDREKFDGA
jgi:hypothetical protein